MSFPMTAVSERDPNDYQPEDRRGNSGKTDDRRWLLDREPASPWGVAEQDASRIMVKGSAGRWEKLLRNRDRSGKLRTSHVKAPS